MIYHESLRPRPFPQVLKDELTNHGRTVSYSEGTRVFSSGDDPDGFVHILSGQISLCRYLEDGTEIIVDLLYPGQWLGAMSFLDQLERSHDAISSTRTTARVLSASRFRALLSEYREVEQFFYREYGKWLRLLLQEIENMVVYTAAPRLAKKLIHLFETSTLWRALSDDPEGPEQPILVTQEQLGVMAGLSRKSVSQFVREWSQAGWLDYRYGQLYSVDCDALYKIIKTKHADVA